MNKEIFLCSICNINSGTCNEDCKFCTQSVKNKVSDIQRYKQKPMDEIVAEAKSAYEVGALGFCLVSSDKGITDKTLKFVCEIARVLTKEVPQLRLIACNGTATLEQLLTLKEAGIKSYNHNLETSREFYPNVCTSHSWDERYKTCQNVKKAGLMLLAGGIFGLGESQEDRISMLESLKSLQPNVMPINFYHHNEDLDLNPNPLTTDEALELVKLSREMLTDTKRIMVAGGRETMFGDRQSEIFDYGANSIVVGNYLTTSGRQIDKDLEMIKELNFKIANKVPEAK